MRRNDNMKLLSCLVVVVVLGLAGQYPFASAFVPRYPKMRTSTQLAVKPSSLMSSKLLPPPPPQLPAGVENDSSTSNMFQQVVQAWENLLQQQQSLPQETSLPLLNVDSSSSSISPFDTSSLLQQQLLWTSLQQQLTALQQQAASLLDKHILTQQLQTLLTDWQASLLETFPQIRPYFETFWQQQQQLESLFSQQQQLLQLSPIVTTIVVASSMIMIAMFLIGNSNASNSYQQQQQQPYPNQRYDPVAAQAYFAKRPLQVVTRGLSILWQSAQFGLALLSDQLNNRWKENEYQRGRELATLLTKLGPTFIKVGQSLSIRTDLLPPAYIRGLETLQDQVPAFDTAIAEQMMQTAWRRPVADVLVEGKLSTKPVAAASLGQVYKATLKDTQQPVAIKVQRPAITEQIALDMHLLRTVAPVVKQIGKLNSDTVGTVDAWGLGFVDELDYLQEAANAEFFSERIQETPLKEVVFAPTVVEKYTTRSVLVTEWVDGERLDKSSSEDVTVLCSIAMNTYLTMLLELGLLHCDPHPGNLLRTKDGRLCILDWGMVTRLDRDLQLTLIEHMAHLTSADYAEIPRDLLLLGFIPPEKKDLIGDSGVVEVLAGIYGAWTKGGGAAAINVNDVIAQLQNLTAEKGNLFQIPPYFAYIAKSFSVLEGIGLSNDPKYSIVNECLPYVSRRLLTDKENMGPALSTFIFGPDKAKSDRIVDYDRVEQLVEGFGNYATSASGALLGKEDLSRRELLEQSADQILDLVFTEEDTPLQQIILEQLAKIVSASGRSIFTRIRERSGTLPSGRTVLGTMIDPLGLWRTSPLVRMNELDEKTIETTQKLIALMQKQLQKTNNPAFDLSNLSREESLELVSILVRKIWSRRFGVLKTGNRFARTLLQLTAEKLEAGERDSRILPPQPTREAIEGSLPSARSRALEGSPPKLLPQARDRPTESRRLQQARELLEGLQKDNSANTTPQPVPAKHKPL